MSSTTGTTKCPGCGHDRMYVYFEVERAPVLANVLWDSREEALAAPRAPIRLGYCPDCSLSYNVTFDPSLLEYSAVYENSLHFSPRFQQYAEQLAAGLVERYDLRGKSVVEIGCGQGDFLDLLVRFGAARATGFDPSFDPVRSGTASRPEVTILPETYSEAHLREPADLVCCRHVLEHIGRPYDFLRRVRRAVGDRVDTVVFFEVPNALYTLKDLGIWDIIYEHCSYFTPAALERLFIRAGFESIGVAETYDGQFLTIEARPRVPDASASPRTLDPGTESLVRAFCDAYRTKADFWQAKMARLRAQKARAVVWGAGSKGITFLNTLGLSHQDIEYAVDVNPAKQGRYLTGTGQRIVSPVVLRDYDPQVAVVMNPIYRSEIKEALRSLGCSAVVHVA